MSLRDQDPKGRVDVALFRGAEKFAKHIGAEHIWNGGLGEVAEALIENTGLSKPVSAMDVAHTLGIVRQKRKVR